jgi:hypothetical protein
MRWIVLVLSGCGAAATVQDLAVVENDMVTSPGDLADLTPPPLGNDVLIYRGSGGVPPNQFIQGAWNYSQWSTLLPGTSVVDTTTWPASLDNNRVIALVGLGTSTMGAALDSGQQAAVGDWVSRGGTLLILQDIDTTWTLDSVDYDTSQSRQAMNAMLTAMQVPITLVGTYVLGGFYSLPLDSTQPLGQNVGSLSCGAGSKFTFAAPAQRIDTLATGTDAVLAVAPVGKGRVVVLGDQDCLSDYENGTAVQGSPLGVFLSNLL